MSAALWTSVKLRYSVQTLKLLTNADLQAASAIDDTKGTQVADDAREWFAREVGLTYDSTDTAHVPVAVLATYVLLREYAGKTDQSVKDDRERAVSDMKGLRSRTTAAKATPQSSIVPVPSSEDVSTGTERPIFDAERFDGIIPNSPPSSS